MIRNLSIYVIPLSFDAGEMEFDEIGDVLREFIIFGSIENNVSNFLFGIGDLLLQNDCFLVYVF